MSWDKNITSSVSAGAQPVTKAQFTIPMFLSSDATFSERVRKYSGSTEAENDTELGARGLAAVQAHFSAKKHAPSIMVGRAADSAAAQVVTETIGGTPAEGDKVKITILGVSGEFTAAATPTTSSVATGIRNALTTALAGEDVTVGGTGDDITITADTAGEGFDYSSSYTQVTGSTGTITEVLTTANAGIYTDLVAIAAENNTWFGLTNEVGVSAAADKTMIKECARYAETHKKLFVGQSSEADVKTKTAGNIALWLKTRAYSNTAYCFHHDDDELLHVAAMAYKFEADPDLKATDWAYTPLTGITVADPVYGSTVESNLEDQYANYVENLGGNPKFGMGLCADGRPILYAITDIWYEARLDEAYAQLLSDVSADNDVIGWNDKDLERFPAAADGVNATAERAKHANPGTASASVPAVSDIPAALISANKVPVTAGFERRGTANKVTVDAYVQLPQ